MKTAKRESTPRARDARKMRGNRPSCSNLRKKALRELVQFIVDSGLIVIYHAVDATLAG